MLEYLPGLAQVRYAQSAKGTQSIDRQWNIDDARTPVTETVAVRVKVRMQQQRARRAFERTIGTGFDMHAIQHQRGIGRAVSMGKQCIVALMSSHEGSVCIHCANDRRTKVRNQANWHGGQVFPAPSSTTREYLALQRALLPSLASRAQDHD